MLRELSLHAMKYLDSVSGSRIQKYQRYMPLLRAYEKKSNSLTLRQVPPVHQRILPRAKRKPCPENNASEPGGRPAAGGWLNYIIVPRLTILHEVGDGDAVQVFVDDFVETLPERESFTASHSGTVGAAGL